MKFPSLFAVFLVFIFSFFISFSAIVYAQTASDSATNQTLPVLPTLLPTITATPTPVPQFSIIQQLNNIENTTILTSSNEATVTTPDDQTSSTATFSASSTPDIVASGSAQDYCLNVPVIMYHHVAPMEIATQLGYPQLTEDSTIFEEHISYLKSHHYHFLALEDLVHAIINRQPIPSRSVVITIDDGYYDAYMYAFMMAKKYQAIINFMVPTGLIGQPDYMTWDDLKEMAQSPYARIYNHTTTHAALGLIDQDQIITEVTTANQALKNNLGIKNDIVVYPYGSYNDLAIQTLQQLGMIAAVSTDPGTNECLSNIYKLPRVRVGNEPIENYGY